MDIAQLVITYPNIGKILTEISLDNGMIVTECFKNADIPKVDFAAAEKVASRLDEFSIATLAAAETSSMRDLEELLKRATGGTELVELLNRLCEQVF